MEGRNVSCPLQLQEADIPIAWYDIRSGVQGLRQLLRTLNHRDAAIAPFVICGVPVTPYKNPITEMTSHHIVRLWDSEPPPQVEHRFVLDLLMCDENTYFAAFRRLRFTDEEEFQDFLAGFGVGQGGTWFQLMDTTVPPFLNAVPIGVPSAHGDPRPGGVMVLESIYNTLCKFELDNGGPGPVTQEVRRASWDVMVYCEIRRFRSLLVLVNHRLQYDFPPYGMENMFWDLIHDWADMSTIVLEEFQNAEFQNSNLALGNVTPQWCMHLGLPTMSSLIGVWGELLKIKLDRSCLGMTEE